MCLLTVTITTHQNSWETHTPSHCTTLTTPNDTHRLSRGLRTCQLYTVVLSGLCAVLDQAHPTPPFLTQPRPPTCVTHEGLLLLTILYRSNIHCASYNMGHFPFHCRVSLQARTGFLCHTSARK